jgi:hypothetical protein
LEPVEIPWAVTLVVESLVLAGWEALQMAVEPNGAVEGQLALTVAV